MGIAVVQGNIYAIGGDDGGLNEVYDPTTDQWTTKTAMSTPRSGINAHAVEGKIYVIGGMFSGENADEAVFYDINEVYDPKTDTWSTGTPIPTPVAGYASVVVDKQIYVVGGLTVNWNRVNLTQIYNSATDTWSTGKHIPTIVGNSGAGATTGVSTPKKIYVIGGTIGPVHVTIPDLTYSIQVTSMVQIYDPETDEWSTGTQMPTARAGLSVAVVDDVLYAIGGGNVSPAGLAGSDFDTNEQYTPEEYTPTSSPVTTPTPELQQTEQFPTTLVVVVLGIVAVVSVGLLVYFRKRNR